MVLLLTGTWAPDPLLRPFLDLLVLLLKLQIQEEHPGFLFVEEALAGAEGLWQPLLGKRCNYNFNYN